MMPVRHPALLTIPLVVALMPAVFSQPANSESAPARITTDTPEYCLQLLDRVSELVRIKQHPPQEVTELSTQGERMCNQGQTLGGIMRLRRALVMLEGQR